MMRGGKVVRKILEPDPVYNSRLVTRFINKLMKDGRKATAQKVVYDAMEEIKEASKQDPLSIFEKALANVSPKMEVRPRRVGGASYQVPVEVRGDRREALSIRWILAGAETKPNKEYHSFAKKLAAELMDAANNAGVAIKKKDDMQKVANANRAFSHFRW
ncbi:30S ribosomal protein S7 [Candidatus Daviesbacteria bacterium RIFCSPLOWO2_02_FULL_36_8]|uniref:Small ribosomal subunit protein uS7 n=1 Tax=Candidatus Daviesbacteria bacterium RIFCSPLOWO2_02_FULL_36_8 TaxID=1797793 RepID=A0A1F5MFG9_9BACT|nr:MAG: 30S ribosomal protein S7 [Candidatus Daviesbacteria bacterium RIFCSPLOWO2_02_FULL_36_8]